MNHFIAAFDGLRYSLHTRDAAIEITQNAGAYLSAIFLDDLSNTSYKIYQLIEKEGVSEKKLLSYKSKDFQQRIQSAKDFETVAHAAGIHFNIHHDKRIAINELIHESSFADLLIVDSKETLTHYSEKSPTRFIKDLLRGVQCPVLLVSQTYTTPTKVVFLYDGSPSSIYAIKMFDYLLKPIYKDITVELLTVKGMEEDLHLPDHKLMKEFIKLRYQKPVYTILKGLAETEIINFVQQLPKSTLLVLGAYGRSIVSNWFKSSLSGGILKETSLPMFIAHYR
jgi:hypothetical protein